MITKEKNKGNIPLDYKLLNKYNNVIDMINDFSCVPNNIVLKLDMQLFDFSNIKDLTLKEIKKLAINIFEKNHTKNIFYNDDNEIIVSHSDINESISKILMNGLQKQYLIEHLAIFSVLGKVIEHAVLTSQNFELKSNESQKRRQNLLWNYYLDNLIINNIHYIFEFDVVSRNDGENHYRVQRLFIKPKKQIFQLEPS